MSRAVASVSLSVGGQAGQAQGPEGTLAGLLDKTSQEHTRPDHRSARWSSGAWTQSSQEFRAGRSWRGKGWPGGGGPCQRGPATLLFRRPRPVPPPVSVSPPPPAPPPPPSFPPSESELGGGGGHLGGSRARPAVPAPALPRPRVSQDRGQRRAPGGSVVPASGRPPRHPSASGIPRAFARCLHPRRTQLGSLCRRAGPGLPIPDGARDAAAGAEALRALLRAEETSARRGRSGQIVDIRRKNPPPSLWSF